ncbi:MAG: flagellar filament capping protein FliD [Gallionella sp.]
MATTAASASTSSTIDVQSLVSQLMTVANQPINTLNTKISTEQTKISDFGTISSLVSAFQTSVQGLKTSLQGNSAASSNTSVFSASASSASVAGNYSVNVSSLAQAQSLVSAGQTSATAAIGNGTATTVTFDFGTTSGTTFTTNGGGTKSITVDSTNNTLQGIASAINAANMGVTATIVNDGSATAPYRIALTSNNSGASNSLKITTTGGDGTINNILAYDPAGTKNLSQTAAAQNASFTVNGIAINSTSNTVTTAIQGVTLTLNGTSTTPANLTVAHDTQGISTAVTSFTTAYNALYNQLKGISAYGSSTTAAPDLAGDGTVRAMMSQLEGVFNTPATPASGGSLNYLAQIGISFQTNGTLAVNSTTLNNAMSTNFGDVTNLFSSASGFATRLDAWSTSVLSPGNGLISTATQSLTTSITNNTNQVNQLQARMKTLQAQYIQQYTALNMLLTNMDSTSAYLTQQLSKN